MSKKNQKESVEAKEVKAFTLVPKDGGYSVVEVSFNSKGEFTSTNEVHPPDVLSISLSILSQKVRKYLEV